MAPYIKIAVLTSGGDSAGMNAVVRAVVKIGILRQVSLLLFSPLLRHGTPTEVVKHISSARDTKALFAETPRTTSRMMNHSQIPALHNAPVKAPTLT